MKNIRFERNKDKVLVVAGCSHTQGSAFVRKIARPKLIKGKEYYELNTPQLKAKYKKDYITPEWLTENLTWGGKLKKLIRADKVINFGFGGFGIESVIRSLRNYSYKVDDLTNTLFVIQVPSASRKEVFVVKEDGTVYRDGIRNIARSAQGDPFGFMPPDEIKMTLVNNYYDPDVVEIELYYELYALQAYLESKGAMVRMFFSPFTNIDIKSTLQVLKYKHTLEDWDNVSLYKDLHSGLEFEEMLSRLNTIDLTNLQQVRNKNMKNPRKWTLHSDGTVPGDQHYNEEGNKCLAISIKENINRKANPIELEQVVEMEEEGEKVIKTLI